MTARPAIFLDRDGTLVRDIAWGAEPGELELLPGVAPALRALRAAGFALVVASNQAGVARGLFDLDEGLRSGAHLAALLAASGAPLDGYYLSPYHESACRVAAFSRASEARKPGSGMLRAAAADLDLDLARSWIIGDHLSDVAAGLAAGGGAILLDIGQLGWPSADVIPAILHAPRTFVARNLPHAAALILATESPPPPAVLGEGVGGRGRVTVANGSRIPDDLAILGPPLPPATLVRPTPPPDHRAPGEPCPWPDLAWMARAEADGLLLAAGGRL